MQTPSEPHDVFLSYAREDLAWVREHLYAPLLRTRTACGRPPRIFFDLGKDGIQVGQDFKKTIDNAIENVAKFVPVYSWKYFQKDMCIYELELAQSRDMNFCNQVLLPLLIDQAGAGKIPFAFRRLNYLSIDDPEWFKKLCAGLELLPYSEKITLAFLDPPGDVFANHTLPVVRVAVEDGGQRIGYEEEVKLAAASGQLLGTTTAKTKAGIATFDDLSIGDAVGKTRLIASATAAADVTSEPFHVFPRAASPVAAAQPVQAAAQVTLPSSGEVVFFQSGQHVAVLEENQASVYGVDGAPCGAVPLRAPIRLVRRAVDHLVLADWAGNVYLLAADGNHNTWALGRPGAGFAVPADVDVQQGAIFAAFWNGAVYQLAADRQAELIHREADGIQATGVYGDRLYVADFAGNLRIYRNRRLVNSATLEPTIWLLAAAADCLVAVGERRFYHIAPDGARVRGFDMPLAELAAVYELSDRPVVTDVRGRGIRFDKDLAISSAVSVQPGARPVSADDGGRYCIFHNPDGTRTLLQRDRIVFSHAAGSLAVSPSGHLFALGDERQVLLYEERQLKQIIEQTGAAAGAEAAASPTLGSPAR